VLPTNSDVIHHLVYIDIALNPVYYMNVGELKSIANTTGPFEERKRAVARQKEFRMFTADQVKTIYECVGQPSFERVMAAQMSSWVPDAISSYRQTDLAGAHLLDTHYDEETYLYFKRNLEDHNPVLPACTPSLTKLGHVRVSDFLDLNTLRQSDFGQKWLVQEGFLDEVALVTNGGTAGLGFFAWSFDPSVGKVPDSLYQRLVALKPTLRHAGLLHNAISARSIEKSNYLSLSPSGEICSTRGVLAEHLASILKRNHFNEWSIDCSEFQDGLTFNMRNLIELADSTPTGQAPTVGISSVALKLKLTVTKVNVITMENYHTEQRFIAIVETNDNQPNSLHTALQAIYGLTAKEAEITMRLQYASIAEIARDTDRSENTVRTHVKRVLQKMNASSQREVITSVNSLNQSFRSS